MMVIQELKLPVVVVSPFERNTIELKKIATLCKKIRKGVLQASQFNSTLTDTIGEITRPNQW